MELKRILERLDGLFLGVVEELPGLGRLTMKVLPDHDFVAKSYNATRYEGPTPVYSFLANPTGVAWLDLIFTNQILFSKCKYQRLVSVKKVIDLKNERLGRTIILVDIGGDQLVLKCIGNSNKTYGANATKTPTQDEAFNFDTMPETLKTHFVKKYAHGRLWIGDAYNCEAILMESLFEEAITKEMVRRIRSNDGNFYAWWSQAIGMLLKIHRNGYIHGDSALANFSWSVQGIGSEIKMIDPERMKNITSRDVTEKNLLKLCDIYHVIFHSVVYATLAKNAGAMEDVDFKSLHGRLDTIYQKLSLSERSLFLLNDVIIYSDSISSMALDVDNPTNLPNVLSYHRSVNPQQFSKLSSIDTDPFLERLCDPLMLRKTVEYIILQTKRFGYPIEALDLLFPGSSQTPHQPTLPTHHLLPHQAVPVFSPQAAIHTPTPHVQAALLIINDSQVMMSTTPHWLKVCYSVANGVCNLYLASLQGLIPFNISSKQQLFITNKGSQIVEPAHDNFHNTFFFYVDGLNLIVEKLQTSGVISPFQVFSLATNQPTLTIQYQ